MVHVATEMEKRGMKIPLLIGGATTSEMHTAVKIAPEYSQPVVHVRDASRAPGVLAALTSPEKKGAFAETLSIQFERLRKLHENTRAGVSYISLLQARQNRLQTNWNQYVPPKPTFTGVKFLGNIPLSELVPFIDWTFFFHAWKITGKYPDIFAHSEKGAEARKLFNDAQELLGEIVDKKMLTANAVFGFFPAVSDGDDIRLEIRQNESVMLHFLRNQEVKNEGIANLCLSDFVAPRETGCEDFLGLFTVTAGIGIEKWVEQFEKQHDDYRAIMLKILADRLAEAAAEWLHLKVRRDFWGYEKDGQMKMENILKADYRGIRPAPGYPACPDHSEKAAIFTLLGAAKAGITLTENYAMRPAASVCGYYFSHPDSQYFTIGKISPDQVEDYALRKNLSIQETEKLLETSLNY
jgi:5-methyltetrahydrofolate--homocysteine methyltransferase